MKIPTTLIVTITADDGADWDVHLEHLVGIVLVEIVRGGEVVCTVMPDGFHAGDVAELVDPPCDSFELEDGGCDFDLAGFVKAAC